MSVPDPVVHAHQPSRHWLKLLLRVDGVGITIVALVFVGLAIFRSLGDLREAFGVPRFLAAMAGGALAYALILQFVGLGWYVLLRSVDGPSLGHGRALAIFGRTQIYKYLPTNVGHFVGRFMIARQAGVSGAALAFSQAGELALTVLSSATVAAVLAYPLLIERAAAFGVGPRGILTAYLVLGAAAIGGTAVVVPRLGVRGRSAYAVGALAAAALLYLAFFLGSGALAALLAATLSGTFTEWAGIVGIAAAGWLVGFVVPGAPGGLGVREAVMISGMTAAGLPASSATAVALGHRLLTVVGDVIVASGAFFLTPRSTFSAAAQSDDIVGDSQ